MGLMNNSRVSGVLGIFDDPQMAVAAATSARKKGWQKFDVYAPFPMHALGEAIGIPRSRIPWVTLIAGLTGGAVGFLFQCWTSAVAWPINIGGKPFVSWPAFIPVAFELTILIAGLATAAALFISCKLPNLKNKIMDPRLTDDRFGLFVPADEVDFDVTQVTQFLKEAKANDVREIH